MLRDLVWGSVRYASDWLGTDFETFLLGPQISNGRFEIDGTTVD